MAEAGRCHGILFPGDLPVVGYRLLHFIPGGSARQPEFFFGFSDISLFSGYHAARLFPLSDHPAAAQQRQSDFVGYDLCGIALYRTLQGAFLADCGMHSRRTGIRHYSADRLRQSGCGGPTAIGDIGPFGRDVGKLSGDRSLSVHYREKGGFYRHIYSLSCRWRRAKYHDKVVRAYQQDTDAPALSNHSGVIVSLTTFPPRISQLHLMLKSILWQTCPPEKIIVWLSEQEFPGRLNDLPEELKILMAKGIEFRFVSENFRSHKKYHYVFREYPDSKVITVDDDLIYPRNTVERLLSLSYQYPDTVCGNVIRKIHMDGNSFSVYRKWTKVFTMPVNSSLQNVAIGCGGIYYPPHWYGEELFDWKIISEHCPSADDLWLKANELKRRVEVTGGGEFYPRPIELPQTQNNSLQKKNNGKTNLNDKQWKSLNELWKLDELYCINGK